VACSSNNYPPQRTWVGLTDEEIGMAFRAVFPVGGVVFTNGATEFAQTIERKLKEKNHV
jgi:delta 1-pyrroline-5-carboxylate dehydrogenase